MQTIIEIPTEDGMARALMATPAGTQPTRGVIVYMDAMGLRQSFADMADHIAQAGYVVLVPDLFYRLSPYGPYTGASFADPVARAKIMAATEATPIDLTRRDSAAFVHALDAAGVSGPIGVVGYCLGGARALTVAATFPERIVAAATFHGSDLASEAPDSPHRLAAQIKARVYVGNAPVDDTFPPEQSGRLAQALREGGVDYAIENYTGVSHGWTVADNPTYDRKGAERHWTRLLRLFDETMSEVAVP